jgi:hypothetical protein
MTLEVFSRDIVPILQLTVMILGLAAVILLWWQIWQTRLWNKLASPHNFLDTERAARLETALFKVLRRLNIDPNSELDNSQVQAVLMDDEAQITLKAYLNDIENICAAVRIGSVDSDCAYAVHSCRVIEIHKRYRLFIKAIQDFYDDPEVYIETQKVAADWERRSLQDREDQQQRLKKLETALINEKGVKQKV